MKLLFIISQDIFVHLILVLLSTEKAGHLEMGIIPCQVRPRGMEGNEGAIAFLYKTEIFQKCSIIFFPVWKF